MANTLTWFLLTSDCSSRIGIRPALCHGMLTWMGSTCRASLPSAFIWGGDQRAEGAKSGVPSPSSFCIWLCAPCEGRLPHNTAGPVTLSSQVLGTAPPPRLFRLRVSGQAPRGAVSSLLPFPSVESAGCSVLELHWRTLPLQRLKHRSNTLSPRT